MISKKKYQELIKKRQHNKKLTLNERKKLDHELHFSGIKNYLNAMKNNAGIKITGSNGLSKYCMDYLKAFDNCEMFLGWAKWGNVYKYIIDSHMSPFPWFTCII